MSTKVRVLPVSSVHALLDTLLVEREDLQDMLVLKIFKDGTTEVTSNVRSVMELVGFLELLKKQMLESCDMECEYCGGTMLVHKEPQDEDCTQTS